ncbi:hypothetical protein RJI07_04820 [Mycoplasmatota bacterium WC30]
MYIINANDDTRTIVVHRESCMYAKRASSVPGNKCVYNADNLLEIEDIINEYPSYYRVTYCGNCKPRP